VSRPIKAIEIYLPPDDNEGRPIDAVKFVQLEDELLLRFGGVTSTQRQFPLRGLWQAQAQVFQDKVVVWIFARKRSSSAFVTWSVSRPGSRGSLTNWRS
jgi:hypothetical protein